MYIYIYADAAGVSSLGGGRIGDARKFKCMLIAKTLGLIIWDEGARGRKAV